MWIIYTLLAVISQLVRNLFSKKLSSNFSPESVSFARFLFGIPVVFLGLIVSWFYSGAVEITSGYFFLTVTAFSVFQILANVLLVSLFHTKNFAVALTFIKSEAIFIVFLAMIFLSEFPSFWGGIGISIAFIGLLVSALAKDDISLKSLKVSLSSKDAYVGLLSGFFFALAVFFVKKSFIFLSSDSLISETFFIVFSGLLLQSSILFLYLFVKKRSEIIEMIKSPKIPFLIGTASGVGSFFWFLAFASAYIAYVKTLGQIEFVFGVLVSIFYFKEKISRNEYLGMGLMMVGMVLVNF